MVYLSVQGVLLCQSLRPANLEWLVMLEQLWGWNKFRNTRTVVVGRGGRGMQMGQKIKLRAKFIFFLSGD